MTADLVAFLRARLDEDERIARAATPGPWEQTPERVGFLASEEYWDVVDCSGTPAARENAEHIARHDPARVLADIDAKRQLIALHQEKQEQGYGSDFCAECGFGEVSQSYYPCGTLRLLALPYAGHPDYREEWRP